MGCMESMVPTLSLRSYVCAYVCRSAASGAHSIFERIERCAPTARRLQPAVT